MTFVYYLLFSLVVFLSALIGYKKFRSTTLYALAIGGVVNANFFHGGNYPIMCFGLPFGIDSIIYTLFVFCVIVMFVKVGKKSAYTLAFSSIIAIMFSALMQFFATLLSGVGMETLWPTFLTFCVSSVASVIAMIAVLEILSLLKNKTNSYVLLILGVVIATAINSPIYYSLAVLLNGTPANLWVLIATSVIGKIIALLCGLLTMFVINKIDNTKKQENEEEQAESQAE